MTQRIQIIIAVKLWCPTCGARHIDETRNGERWDRRAHTTHRCQSCGQDWDVYVSGAPDAVESLTVGESQPIDPQLAMKPKRVDVEYTWPCGCASDKHPNYENKSPLAIEKGPFCKLGWPL